MGSAPLNGVMPLKLIDVGISSDTLALLGVPSIPFELIMPFVLSRFLTGNQAMRTFVMSNTMKYVLFNLGAGEFKITEPTVILTGYY